MSILDPQSQKQPSEAEMKAQQVIRTSADTARRIIRNWEMMYDFIWNSSDPQAVLDEIGTDGAEVFSLSSSIIALMQSTLPEALPQEWERIEAKIAQIPEYTIDQDGKVTITT